MKLHSEATPPKLLALLRRLMESPELANFYLVGGTALALRFGHRVSVDIDLFTAREFDAPSLQNTLTSQFQLVEASCGANSISGEIEEIKIDCLAHQYAKVKPTAVIDGIRFMATEDIAAMKLNAITNRGSKKDFWDYRELLRHFSPDDMLGFYRKKYPNGSIWNVKKSLSYFADAENEPDPRDLQGHTWAQIKADIIKSNRL